MVATEFNSSGEFQNKGYMMKNVILISAIALMAACAQTPGSIKPADVGNPYTNLSCSQAQNTLATERSKLDALTVKQKNAVAADAIGVFLIGIPAASLTGNDVSGEIAISKGKVLSLESRVSTCK